MNAIVIGSIGRLERVKGYDILLNAFARAHHIETRLRLLLIGDGSQRNALEQLARELGIASSVELTGHQLVTTPWLSRMDYVVVPSRYEGCSNTLLEAMAAGRPVIATDAGGNSELVQSGETGLLVPPEDPGRLAEAIIQLIRNPEHAQAMAYQARRQLEERFGATRMVQETERVYEDLINSRGCVLP